jgi:hypothetical protein
MSSGTLVPWCHARPSAAPAVPVLACRLRRCEELPALLGVPFESHSRETVNGLLDEQVVFADGAEGPQREWFEVDARLQKWWGVSGPGR